MKEEPVGGYQFPSSVKGGNSPPVYPSIPAVTELRQALREQRVRNGVGSEEERAAAGRSRPKALPGITAPATRGYSPKMHCGFQPPRLSVKDPCLDSEPADDSIHPKKTPYLSRPPSIHLRNPSRHP